MNKNDIKLYKKDSDYSYVIGMSPTVELIMTRPDIVETVFIHSKLIDTSFIYELCADKIPVIHDDKVFRRLNITENNYVIGIFKKYETSISSEKPHILLVNPSDMGNLGSIIRTMVGFGYADLAVITPSADIYNPKTVRASMGAIFKIRFQLFDNITEYMRIYNNHVIYPFMLEKSEFLSYETCPINNLFTLIFGNESSGLPVEYADIGTPLKISQTPEIDSLNLSVAVGIGTYLFAVKNNLISTNSGEKNN